ncbi:LuxR C-terminal-related transcriptional regulator [Streptomyces scopuliridis]|uniref:LuxR C-terminal-related transcriptional regulator n=1 Tax=Streptomyces scopuliridis TaxID=452529 RepID=UPI00369E9258
MNDRPGRLPPAVPRPAPPHLVLDERQLRLIALLLAGHTDVSAAHRLGVSPRTVTNMLRALMNRLGVDNRFQLGAALGTHMWRETAPIRSEHRDRNAFARN